MKKVNRSWNKLVRDGIPTILEEKGIEVTKSKVTDPSKLRWLLKEKLQEETEEAIAASQEHVLEELGDVLSVVYAISKAHGFTDSQLDKQRKRKDDEKGAFNNGVLLISTKE